MTDQANPTFTAGHTVVQGSLLHCKPGTGCVAHASALGESALRFFWDCTYTRVGSSSTPHVLLAEVGNGALTSKQIGDYRTWVTLMITEKKDGHS